MRRRQGVSDRGPVAAEDVDGGMSKPLSGRSNFGLAMAAEMWREFRLGTLCGTEDVARTCGEAAAHKGAEVPGWLGIVPWFIAAVARLVATLMWTSGRRCDELHKLWTRPESSGTLTAG